MAVTVAKHSLGNIPSQEYHPLSLASFCPPSLTLLPSALPAERISPLSNLHRRPEKHRARCWHASLIPHRGWQIISQPLCAEWGQPASQPASKTFCLKQLWGYDTGVNVGTTRSCCGPAGAAGQGWTSGGGVTLLSLQHHAEELLCVITAWTCVLWRCFYLTLKG